MVLNERRKIAAAFNAPPEILPCIPELLAGIWSMGVPTDPVVSLLAECDLPPGEASVLDLGCGKGAVSIALARQFGFRIHGIDLFNPFIEEARKRARESGVEDLCSFVQGDIKMAARGNSEYDLVLLIWMGDVLGDAGKSVGRMRRLVRSGGYMVIGDGCLKDGVKAHGTVFQRFDSRPATKRKLLKHGDTVIREMTIPQHSINDFYGQYIHSLQRGARKCARQHPEHADALWQYVNTHKEVCRIMESTVDSCLWLIRKENGSRNLVRGAWPPPDFLIS